MTQPVLFDHDGGIDDFVALCLLASAQAKPEVFLNDLPTSANKQIPKIELIGVTLVEADCFAKPAVEATKRLLCLYREVCPAISAIPVACSSLKGTAAPFPDAFRKDCASLADMPVLNTPAVDEAMLEREKQKGGEAKEGTGHELMASLVLSSSKSRVTLCVTGPLTNVAYCINTYGAEFCNKIEKIVWMGGALKVGGNVFKKNLPDNFPSADKIDNSQEWNVYWDAVAAKTVLESDLLAPGQIVLAPLDVCNKTPVTSALVKRFGKVVVEEENKKNKSIPTTLSTFIGTAWSMTVVPFIWAADCYFAWDVLTASFILAPSLMTESKLERIEVVAEAGSPSEGRTQLVAMMEDEEEEKQEEKKKATTKKKKNVLVLYDIDVEKFDNMCVNAARVC